MEKGKQLTSEEIGKIMAYRDQELSMEQISVKIGRSGVPFVIYSRILKIMARRSHQEEEKVWVRETEVWFYGWPGRNI